MRPEHRREGFTGVLRPLVGVKISGAP
jgi:hypothetical protein